MCLWNKMEGVGSSTNTVFSQVNASSKQGVRHDWKLGWNVLYPNTDSFWYLNKVETCYDYGEGKQRACMCWEAPLEFEDILTCVWNYPSSPSDNISFNGIKNGDCYEYSMLSVSSLNSNKKKFCMRFNKKKKFNYQRLVEHILVLVCL